MPYYCRSAARSLVDQTPNLLLLRLFPVTQGLLSASSWIGEIWNMYQQGSGIGAIAFGILEETT